MDAESCVIFSRMSNGFSVEINSLNMGAIFPYNLAVSFKNPGDATAVEKLFEWFYINQEELMGSDNPLVRGSNLTVVELNDLVCSAWSEDDYPVITELMAKFHLIKIINLPD